MPALDLKYRPSQFSQVIGNSGVVKLLLIRSRNRTLDAQSMMLSGPKGCGKTTMARIIAKAISCANLQDGEPCDECPSCISIMNETSPSFEELDAASQGTVDKIRGMIRDADYETIDGAKQVYIIDEAQRLSAAAQEAFLKAIESRLFIVILCTTDPQKVKGPIRSRLEEYPVYPPPTSELLKRLKEVCENENIQYNESGISLLTKIKDNCPRECLIALDTISQLGEINETSVRSYFRFESYEMVSEILSHLDKNPNQAFEILDKLSNTESPTWIKDHIIMAIASALRVGVGAKATFMVPTNFFENRGRGWATVASDLGAIDRINISEIGAILLKESRAIPITAIPEVQKSITSIEPEPQILQTIEPPKPAEQTITKPSESTQSTKLEASKSSEIPAEKPKPKAVDKPRIKEITVDGINFSSNEQLTSLDGKVNKTQPPVSENNSPVLQVELSSDHVPITEKDFSESLISRLKNR